MTLTLHDGAGSSDPAPVAIAGTSCDVVVATTLSRDSELVRLQAETGIRNLLRYPGEPDHEYGRRIEVALARTRTVAAVIATQLTRPGEAWDPDFAEGLAYVISRTPLTGDEALINRLLDRAVHELLTGELRRWEG